MKLCRRAGTDGLGPTAPLIYDGLTQYTPGINECYEGQTSRYYEPDQLGSSLGVMNSSSAQIYSIEYDAFGDQIGSSGSLNTSYAFLTAFDGSDGYQSDRDTGLIHTGSRYYNPYFGRFITQDPVGDGENWYAYCDGDPACESDPSGLDDVPVIGNPTRIYPAPPDGVQQAWNQFLVSTIFGLTLPQFGGATTGGRPQSHASRQAHSRTPAENGLGASIGSGLNKAWNLA